MLIKISIKVYNIFYMHFLSKKHNIILGKNVRIDNNTRINTNNNMLKIGSNVYLRSNRKGYHAGMPFHTTILLDNEGASCIIGNNCRINGAYIHAKTNIIIGYNTVIAAGVNILDSNGHEVYSGDRTKGKDIPKEIVIGNNVWIGLNAIILKGTNIGDNSIIAAGSVVKGVIPSNVIVQGNPAIIVNTLNSYQ
jgi:acetyltransferase-like isoleucine patch superfamily enzyme